MNPSDPDEVDRSADGTDQPDSAPRPADLSEPTTDLGESVAPVETGTPDVRESITVSDPTERTEPTESSEPTEPIESSEPTEAAEPATNEPLDVSDPEDEVEPADLSGTADRDEPVIDEPAVAGAPGLAGPRSNEPVDHPPGSYESERDTGGRGGYQPDVVEQDVPPPEPDLTPNIVFAPEVLFTPEVAEPEPEAHKPPAHKPPAHKPPAYEPPANESAADEFGSAHVALPTEMTVPAEVTAPVEASEPAAVATPVEVGEPAGVRARPPSRRGTRRAARRTTRPSMDLEQVIGFVGYRYATAVLVVLALLALYGAASLSRPAGAARARGGLAPVTSVVLGCPAPAGTRLSALTPGPTRAGTGAARAAADPGGAGNGRADISETRTGAGVNALATPGVSWSQEVHDGGEPQAYTVRAHGGLAAGLEVEQTSAVTKGADRGLAGVRCTEPGTDMWFLGPGPVDAKDIELHLTNVDAQPAAVDALALSGEGPLDTTDGRGTRVAPHSTVVVRIGRSAAGLGELVNSARLLALHVVATTGRVAAAVRVRIDKGEGVDWLPVLSAPSTDVVVPGIPTGDGRRQLLVAVPGDFDARVRLQVITAAGGFAPEGQDTLDAPAQTVTPVNLERALSGKPAAVRLTSDRPIVAGFSAQRGGEVAYGAATGPLEAGGAGGIVADNRAAATSVVLTAPDRAATVRVIAVTAQGAAGSPQEVKIAAGRTVEVRVPAPAGAEKGFGLLLAPEPGSGAVHAARVLSVGKRDGLMFTVLPVVPALVSVPQPRVGDSLTSLIP